MSNLTKVGAYARTRWFALPSALARSLSRALSSPLRAPLSMKGHENVVLCPFALQIRDEWYAKFDLKTPAEVNDSRIEMRVFCGRDRTSRAASSE
eukprot:6194271-Pleurochrysis_carterae.AAC.2